MLLKNTYLILFRQTIKKADSFITQLFKFLNSKKLLALEQEEKPVK